MISAKFQQIGSAMPFITIDLEPDVLIAAEIAAERAQLSVSEWLVRKALAELDRTSDPRSPFADSPPNDLS